MNHSRRRTWCTAASVITLATSNIWAQSEQPKPKPDHMLQYQPRQRDVDFDVPAAANISKCRVEYETQRKPFGYALFDGDGMILRRYSDANGDGKVDTFRYYKHGIEVYRDIDSDFNDKIDQFRWINIGGSRWGIDKNEDGKIDSWKTLSAEEASRVAVNSMILGNMSEFSSVLVTKADLEALGVDTTIASSILRQVQEPAAAVQTVLSKGGLTGQSRWSRLDAAMPATIPADEGKAKSDLVVYESAIAFVLTGEVHGMVQIGEMIKVGDVWKLTQIPKPLNPKEPIPALAGLLMRPSESTSASGNELTPQMQALLKELGEHDKSMPMAGASKAELLKFHSRRLDLIKQLAVMATSTEQRSLWTRQRITALVALIELSDAQAKAELLGLERDIRKTDQKSPLLASIAYQMILSDYRSAVENADAKTQQAANEKWFKNLDGFVEEFPLSDESIEALLALAVNAEYERNEVKARKYYQKLATRLNVPGAVERGTGALRRLDLKGSILKLSGRDVNGRTLDVAAMRGKVIVVAFWDSGSREFHDDLPVLKQLLEQFGDRGLSIIGVSIDQDPQQMTSFIQQNKVTFSSIHDVPVANNPLSTLAMHYGIYKTPLYFLVNQEGKVASNNISIEDLKSQISTAFGKK